MKLTIKVTPNAKKNEVIQDTLDEHGNRHLKLKVTAVPEDGKANEAVLKLLATFLGVKKSQLMIISGETSRYKTVEIRFES